MKRAAAAMLVSLALATATTRASSLEAQPGTLNIHVFNDLDGNGRFSNEHDNTELLPACSVHIFPDLRSFTPPYAPYGLGDRVLGRIAELEPDDEGRLQVPLPTGAYSVVQRGCFNLVPPESEGRRFCCPRLGGHPEHETFRSSSFDFLFQTIEVQPSATSEMIIYGAPEPSVKQVRIYVWITLAAIVAVGAIGGVWKFRPRYEPRSDGKNAKELPIHVRPDPDYEPADFDRVFGDLLNKRRDDEPPAASMSN